MSSNKGQPQPDAVRQYLSNLGKKGGAARAAKYDKKTLSKWAKLGGRPPKKGGTEVSKTKRKP